MKIKKQIKVKSSGHALGSTFSPAKSMPEEIQSADNSGEGLSSFTPIASLTDILNAFIQKQTRKAKDDSNNYISDFALIARMIVSGYKTWCFQDFLSMSRSMNSDASALAFLHGEFLKELRKYRRVKTEQSVYDYEQFTFV